MASQRGANYSTTEKEVLTQLVVENRAVLENKKSDAVSAYAKN